MREPQSILQFETKEIREDNAGDVTLVSAVKWPRLLIMGGAAAMVFVAVMIAAFLYFGRNPSGGPAESEHVVINASESDGTTVSTPQPAFSPIPVPLPKTSVQFSTPQPTPTATPALASVPPEVGRAIPQFISNHVDAQNEFAKGLTKSLAVVLSDYADYVNYLGKEGADLRYIEAQKRSDLAKGLLGPERFVGTVDVDPTHEKVLYIASFRTLMEQKTHGKGTVTVSRLNHLAIVIAEDGTCRIIREEVKILPP